MTYRITIKNCPDYVHYLNLFSLIVITLYSFLPFSIRILLFIPLVFSLLNLSAYKYLYFLLINTLILYDINGIKYIHPLITIYILFTDDNINDLINLYFKSIIIFAYLGIIYNFSGSYLSEQIFHDEYLLTSIFGNVNNLSLFGLISFIYFCNYAIDRNNIWKYLSVILIFLGFSKYCLLGFIIILFISNIKLEIKFKIIVVCILCIFFMKYRSPNFFRNKTNMIYDFINVLIDNLDISIRDVFKKNIISSSVNTDPYPQHINNIISKNTSLDNVNFQINNDFRFQLTPEDPDIHKPYNAILKAFTPIFALIILTLKGIKTRIKSFNAIMVLFITLGSGFIPSHFIYFTPLIVFMYYAISQDFKFDF